MSASLVILAAGVGSRYGGLKQLEAIGPAGETIMDYSAYDALRAGFGRIVFVVRPDMEELFRAEVGRRIASRAPVAYVHQRLDALPDGFTPPAGRTKPWGTGHAVLAAAAALDGPFAVANADDYYGANSFAALGAFLGAPKHGPLSTHAMVAFALRDTMTEAGTVSRGVCRCSADGFLETIEEITKIEKQGGDGRYTDAAGAARLLPGNTLVSMNLWGFQASFLDYLGERFAAFLAAHGQTTDREYYLSSTVGELIQGRRGRVRILPTPDKWCGVTHRQDRAGVEAMIRGLVERGVYPAKLW